MNIFDWRFWYFWRLSWRLWKWRNWCNPKDLVFIRGTWSMKTFGFVVSFSLSWVIGNTVLLKGVEEILRKNFHVMLNSKSHTYQSLRVKPLEIWDSSVNFFSDRDEVLLVSEEFVLTKELGIHQCGLPISEDHDSPEEFDSQISDRCCAMRQLSQISTHLTVISLKGIYVLSCWATP